ncbi:MAG: hypothetical protein QG657_794 [Acidobacteriota bacterium]|nr:hypothetical protein [Acidobacteriota bacterium]
MNYSIEKRVTLFQGEQNRPGGLFEEQYTRWQLISGWNLEPADKIGRILSLYRMGYEAELHSQWVIADYFFDKVLALLKKYFKENGPWEALIKKYELNEDTDTFRRKLSVEVLMGIHLAFFKGMNSREKENAPCYREIKHLQCLDIISKNFLSENDPEKEAIYDDIKMLWLQLYEDRREWDNAITICKEFVKTGDNPPHYKKKLADLYFKKSIEDKVIFKSTVKLSENIGKLEIILLDLPDDISIYHKIGFLYYYLALNNANVGNYAKALLAIAKASVFNPSIPDLNKTKNVLINIMKDYDLKAADLLRNARQNPGTLLNSVEQKIINESRLGFPLLQKYENSEGYRKTVLGRRNAYFKHLWDNIMPLGNDEENWEERSEQLNSALTKLFDIKDLTTENVPEEWSKILVEFPQLQEIPVKNISDFIKDFIAPGDNSIKEVQYRFKSKAFIDPNTIAIQQPGVKKREKIIPIDFWFFSTRDLFFKAAGIVAVLLLSVTIYFSITEPMKEHRRNLAYDRIISAVYDNQNDNFVSLAENIELFLDNLPSLKRDSREVYVKSLYESEFCRWFMNRNNNQKEILIAQASKFKKLMGR